MSDEKHVINQLNEDVANAQHQLHLATREINLLRGELAGYKLAFNALSLIPRLSAKLLANLGAFARFKRTGSYVK